MSEIAREIEKYPLPPVLNSEALRLICLLCHGTQDPLQDPCDTVLIFGTSVPENQAIAARKFTQVFHTLRESVRTVYLTGGETHPGRIESREIFDRIDHSRYPKIDFRLEEKSKDTTGNVSEAIVAGLGQHTEALFITKWAHCRRAELTLRKHLPHMKIRARGYVPVLPGSSIRITPDNWYEHELARRWAWGEVCRIQRYGERGDITYPENVKELVRNIRHAAGLDS